MAAGRCNRCKGKAGWFLKVMGQGLCTACATYIVAVGINDRYWPSTPQLKDALKKVLR